MNIVFLIICCAKFLEKSKNIMYFNETLNIYPTVKRFSVFEIKYSSHI